jgi:hypothetical protein
MKMPLSIIYAGFALSFSGFSARAQSPAPFQEGTLTYQADTVRRLEKTPAVYISKQLVVYQKDACYRFEVLSVNRLHPEDTQKVVHLRNATGIYTWIESTDAGRAEVANFALFESYEEEKQQQLRQPQPIYLPGYSSNRAVEHIKWLGHPADKRLLRSQADQKTENIVVAPALNIPLGAIFPAVRNLPGTPLQFIDKEPSWLVRYTNTAITPQTLPAQLFEVDPSRKRVTMSEAKQTLADF